MIFALDYLGGAMFPNILLANHPRGFGAGFFADTFGNCFPVADKLAKSGNCPVIRIHGPWTNHTYNQNTHGRGIFTALAKTRLLADKYRSVKFQFSPVCESDATGPSWTKLFDKLKANAGNVEIICSIGTRGHAVKGFKIEIHGDTKIPKGEYQYSYDGSSTVDSDVETDKKNHSNAQIIFFWHPSFNLKYKTKLGNKEDEAPNVWANDTAPPLKRICKPTPSLIHSLAALQKKKGSTKLKAKNLWKSHADRHSTPAEDRAYKPVLISPANADEVVLLDGDTVVAKSTKKEPYNDGRFRYYFGSYGYEIATKVLKVLANKTELGSINPAFREGDYR